MYYVTKRSFGQNVKTSEKVFDTEIQGLAQAMNEASEFAQREYPKSHAGKAGLSVLKEYGLYVVRVSHDNKKGSWSYRVDGE